MRKLHIILVSLILSILMLITASAPVMAAKPDDDNSNKPVAWVNWTGSNGAAGHLEQLRISVMKLADVSTVGHFSLRVYSDSGVVDYTHTLYDSYFEDLGASKVAHIKSTMPVFNAAGEVMGNMWVCTRIEDNGEPGEGIDAFTTFFYFGESEPTTWPTETDKGPGLLLDSSFSGFDYYPAGVWNGANVFDPIDNQSGVWFQWLPYMTRPYEIQIHITEDNPPAPF